MITLSHHGIAQCGIEQGNSSLIGDDLCRIYRLRSLIPCLVARFVGRKYETTRYAAMGNMKMHHFVDDGKRIPSGIERR